MSAFTLCLGTPWQYMNFMVVTSNLKFMDRPGVPYRIGHRGGRGVEGKGGLRLGLGSWGAHRPSTRTYPHTSTLPHLPAYLLVPADDGIQLPLTGRLDGGEGSGLGTLVGVQAGELRITRVGNTCPLAIRAAIAPPCFPRKLPDC